MTYGSATTVSKVREFFDRVYQGKASEATVADFENRYRLVKKSPLIDITTKQAKLLENALGDRYVVRAGMRHSAPFIEDAITELKKEGATSLFGIILSPQFSSFIMQGYATAFTEAAKKHGYEDDAIAIAKPWADEEHFITLLAHKTEHALRELQKQYDAPVPVIFTTHSLPKRVIDNDPTYLAQLEATAHAIWERLDPHLEWYQGYQSAGHTPEEWLKPDLVDLLEVIKEKGSKAVLIVPIQFLSDHLEVLYDLDIAARKQCEDLGIAYHRISLPNTDPLFIDTLESIVRSHTFNS